MISEGPAKQLNNPRLVSVVHNFVLLKKVAVVTRLRSISSDTST